MTAPTPPPPTPTHTLTQHPLPNSSHCDSHDNCTHHLDVHDNEPRCIGITRIFYSTNITVNHKPDHACLKRNENYKASKVYLVEPTSDLR